MGVYVCVHARLYEQILKRIYMQYNIAFANILYPYIYKERSPCASIRGASSTRYRERHFWICIIYAHEWMHYVYVINICIVCLYLCTLYACIHVCIRTCIHSMSMYFIVHLESSRLKREDTVDRKRKTDPCGCREGLIQSSGRDVFLIAVLNDVKTFITW